MFWNNLYICRMENSLNQWYYDIAMLCAIAFCFGAVFSFVVMVAYIKNKE